ncbi:uncharacterized protein [Nicotiana tomentosiformis]|uniref:uncharacterized protein n=1 Tax=Nicotiana tomentosiformis TaxID=4098 RepID=UPI00388CEA05
MKKDIVAYVAWCPNFQQVKYEHQRPGGLLQQMEIPEWTWERITMDFVVGLPRTQRMFDVVWVIVDRLTKGSSPTNVVESPNDEAKRFYESLESASRPLHESLMHSELSVAVRLLTIKSDWNISQAGMNAIIGLMSEVSSSINLPNDYYNAKKLVSKLGLSSTKIDCCENGCMLYYKDDAALEACKFCGLSHFKEVTNAKDRFTPFSVSATPYSCWPVFVTPYNLPPEMCMTSPYLFLTCIVPGPSNPKGSIDSTAGKLACPYYMEDTKAFTLRHGCKNTWFDYHRRFLPMDHEFRKNTTAFMKNQTDYDEPPPTLSGEKIWERVKDLPKVMESPSTRIPGYGVQYNWTKQSIFWELPYWKHNLLRHNLDVMHIDKNFFDNLFNIVMDDKNKTKDNLKARMDLQEYCRRRE